MNIRALALVGIVVPIVALSVATEGVISVGYVVQIPPGRRTVATTSEARGVLERLELRTVAVDSNARGVQMPIDLRTVTTAAEPRGVTEIETRRETVVTTSARAVEGLPMLIFKGDTLPTFSAVLKTAGAVQDLTDATGAVLRMAIAGGTPVTKTLDISATPTDGAVSHEWSAVETAALATGVYDACIVVTFADQSVGTWPDASSRMQITVRDRPA